MAKIYAYDVVNKEKDVPMISPVINKHKNGDRTSYQAKGKSKKGNYIYTFLSEKDAKKHITDGDAKKGTGWQSMVYEQIEIGGQLYDLVPVKKKRVVTEKWLASNEKHIANLTRIVERNKILYYEKSYKDRMTWQECMKLASDQIKDEDSI